MKLGYLRVHFTSCITQYVNNKRALNCLEPMSKSSLRKIKSHVQAKHSSCSAKQQNAGDRQGKKLVERINRIKQIREGEKRGFFSFSTSYYLLFAGFKRNGKEKKLFFLVLFHQKDWKKSSSHVRYREGKHSYGYPNSDSVSWILCENVLMLNLKLMRLTIIWCNCDMII